MNCYTAEGAQGVLLSTVDGRLVFRIYAKDHTFVDFDVRHTDLSVSIIDTDAYFYQEPNGHQWLDHSPDTLGIGE
jgi:hypothetical protein